MELLRRLAYEKRVSMSTFLKMLLETEQIHDQERQRRKTDQHYDQHHLSF